MEVHLKLQRITDNSPFFTNLKQLLPLMSYPCCTGGVPINMGIQRRLEYRLWFQIIDKWHKMHQKNIEITSFPKCGLHFFVSFTLTELLNIWTVLLNFYVLINWNLDRFSNISVKKNNIPHFGNPETILVFGVKCFTTNYIYKDDIEVVIQFPCL